MRVRRSLAAEGRSVSFWSASTPKTHLCVSRSGSFRTNRSSDSIPRRTHGWPGTACFVRSGTGPLQIPGSRYSGQTNAEVLRAAPFHGGLRDASSTFCNEVEGFHDHTFAALEVHLGPPMWRVCAAQLILYAIPQGHDLSYNQVAAPARDAFEAKQIKLCGAVANEFQLGIPQADVLGIAHANG